MAAAGIDSWHAEGLTDVERLGHSSRYQRTGGKVRASQRLAGAGSTGV
ncbi:MAG: hypothetical protein VX608_05995 [Chloroflexota bacterium]|nr:hypothetical protein [Chloroflexota bacterium]